MLWCGPELAPRLHSFRTARLILPMAIRELCAIYFWPGKSLEIMEPRCLGVTTDIFRWGFQE